MRLKTKWIAGIALALALAGGATGVASATTGADDAEAPLAGPAHDRAVAAALAKTGGGTVTETEAGDDGAAYSVEVRLADGGQVEVNLDGGFKVIGQEADHDAPGEK